MELVLESLTGSLHTTMDKDDLEQNWNELFTHFYYMKYYFNYFGENPSVMIYDLQYPRFLELEVNFKKLNDETTRYNEINQENQISLDKRCRIVDIMRDIKKKYLSAQNLHLHTSPVSDGSNLPNIPIFVFDGTIEKWPEFDTLFNTLVHYNYNVPEKYKLQYLKRYLTGEAARVISEFSITEENYQLAYDKLQNQYNGLRYRGQYYVGSMLKYKEDHFDNQRYLNTHETAVYSLRAMNLPNLAECILFYIAYYNLDRETQKKFDTKYSSGTSIPTTKQLFDFVRQCDTAEDINSPEIITLD